MLLQYYVVVLSCYCNVMLLGYYVAMLLCYCTVSYTHLTLPTNSLV